MTLEEFLVEVEASHSRSKRVLLKKREEYSDRDNVLENFFKAGVVQDVSITAALVGQATKQFTSIAKMAKHPELYNLKRWHEKTTDLRNYTYLLDAILSEMDIG